MTSKEILTHLDVEGYCVIENLIPPDEIVQVRESVAGHLQAAFEENERKMAEVRGKGHRIGGAGVQRQPVPADKHLLIRLATGGFSRLQKLTILRFETRKQMQTWSSSSMGLF